MTSLNTGSPASTVPAGGETGSRADEIKVVLVVREGLPAGHAVNAAAVLGASVGTARDLPHGPTAVDASGTH